jgi:polyphenol oxidase
MIRKNVNGVQWLEFELIADIPNLQHAVFLRHGGVSQGEWGSLNVGFSVGDSDDNVKENLKRISKLFNASHLISSNQCHGKAIYKVIQLDDRVPHPCDALTTQGINTPLLIKHADCQAAIFYDPINHAVANVHAGWRGNVQNIYSEIIQFMKHAYFSKPENLLVCISPSLGPDQSEFINFRNELPEPFWEFQIKPSYFDLWAVSKMQLTKGGILPHHIQFAEMCTRTNPEDFFSYRRCKNSGRHATVVALKGS